MSKLPMECSYDRINTLRLVLTTARPNTIVPDYQKSVTLPFELANVDSMHWKLYSGKNNNPTKKNI